MRKTKITTLTLIALLAAHRAAFAAGEVTQNTSYQAADQRNRQGSDTSLQHSTAYAMTALMDLSNLNVPGAVNNGMTAYGKYRNSQTMDRLGDMNLMNASSMSSVGTQTAPIKKTVTTYRRLDPSFLRQGKFAAVANEFEQRSGMGRETFLSQMSDVSETMIQKSDPNLVPKVLGQFEKFVSKIPNPEFKANLMKGAEMVPADVRSSLITKAVKKFAGVAGGMQATGEGIPGLGTAATAGAVAAAAPATSPATAATAAISPAVEASAAGTGRNLAQTDPSMISPFSKGKDDGKNPLGNIVQAALDQSKDDPTIFQIVTRKIRALTPGMLPQATNTN